MTSNAVDSVAIDRIRIVNAQTHNLKGVDLEIPHGQLAVITGVSGSGKSSLAIDTLYAEGQRQYIESLSTYARQFLQQLEKPDVEWIDGLQPTLCIDQQAGVGNPRSTVGTVTEVYDYLRLLMARVGTPICYGCGKAITQMAPEQISDEIMALPERTKLVLMAPVVRGRRGAHREQLSAIRKAGLVTVRVDGDLMDIDEVPELAPRKNHTLEAVVDKIVVRPDSEERVAESVRMALELASGLASISYLTPEAAESTRDDRWQTRQFSALYACPDCGISYDEIEPRTFSFNSPYGACPDCHGVGKESQIDPELVAPNWDLAPSKGAFEFLVDLPSAVKRKFTTRVKPLVEAVGAEWSKPLSALTKPKRRQLVLGDKSTRGIVGVLEELDSTDEESMWENVRRDLPCSTCGGSRLRKEAEFVRIAGKSLFDICSYNLIELQGWLNELQLPDRETTIARSILTEVGHRLTFLLKVGVGYLSLARSADSLSGGELQRVRLATSIGCGLVGVCYVLDEPSIGLHQRDNDRLIESLRELQQQGNTVVVVEHDEAMMRAADLLVDVGPGAGRLGGKIVARGTPTEVAEVDASITGRYLRNEATAVRELGVDRKYLRSPKKNRQIALRGATLHNLQKVDVDIPLGILVGITGVSGSGKSSLISGTLVPALKHAVGQTRRQPHDLKSLQGHEHIARVVEVTQTPIGRSPRSTPATYCGVFDHIRKVWANTREAKQRGFTASRFSFNSGEGRCPDCLGQGQNKIEMNFLPDLHVLCTSCRGRRFNRQTLAVRYREQSIADCLAMSVDEALDFFQNFERIYRMLSCLQQVGLGYLALGQSSSTLSGGEAQRIKLATELATASQMHVEGDARNIYFLDEPTTGLHFEDVRRLVGVLDSLVEAGNTVVVIEHNIDVIQSCDWLIDLGPEGGNGGGEIVACGPPHEVASCERSLTARYLEV